MSWEYKYVPHKVVILKYHSAWHRIRAQYIILSTGVTGPGGQLVQIETNQKHQERNFSLDEIDRILVLSEGNLDSWQVYSCVTDKYVEN